MRQRSAVMEYAFDKVAGLPIQLYFPHLPCIAGEPVAFEILAVIDEEIVEGAAALHSHIQSAEDRQGVGNNVDVPAADVPAPHIIEAGKPGAENTAFMFDNKIE